MLRKMIDFPESAFFLNLGIFIWFSIFLCSAYLYHKTGSEFQILVAAIAIIGGDVARIKKLIIYKSKE